MRNVFVVTHAQSIHHIENKVGGWYDTGLTGLGNQQAKSVANLLKEIVGDQSVDIYTSDLKRASETSAFIASAFSKEHILDSRLRENSYGVAEGKEQTWLDQRMSFAPHENRMDHICVEGAETKRQFVERIYNFMDELSDVENTVIVTHGFALTFVISAWIGLPIDNAGYVNFRASPAGLTYLQEDDLFQNRAVRFVNDTKHLTSK